MVRSVVAGVAKRRTGAAAVAAAGPPAARAHQPIRTGIKAPNSSRGGMYNSGHSVATIAKQLLGWEGGRF